MIIILIFNDNNMDKLTNFFTHPQTCNLATTTRTDFKGLRRDLRLTGVDLEPVLGIDYPITSINKKNEYFDKTFISIIETTLETNRLKPKCYSLSIMGTPLEGKLGYPDFVAKYDLFEKNWPSDSRSQLGKLLQQFLCVHKNYSSQVSTSFAGSSRWFQVVNSGSITFQLIAPTRGNISRYEALKESRDLENFTPLSGTSRKYHLKEDDCLYIPCGYIYSFTASEDTYMLNGQFFHMFNLDMQLDFHDLEAKTMLPTSIIMTELRLLYWFTVINTMSDFNAMSKESVNRAILLTKLEDWRHMHRIYGTFAPLGLDLDKIIKKFRMTSYKRKSIS